MKWSNCSITRVEPQLDGSIFLYAELLESDKDFKSTKKLNWISAKTPFVKVNLIEYDHLLKVKKVDETMDFE